MAQPEQVAGQDEVDPGPVQRQRRHRHTLHPNAQDTQVAYRLQAVAIIQSQLHTFTSEKI